MAKLLVAERAAEYGSANDERQRLRQLLVVPLCPAEQIGDFEQAMVAA
jgi:hypothetical protein